MNDKALPVEASSREEATSEVVTSVLTDDAPTSPVRGTDAIKEAVSINGFHPLPQRGGVVTNELVDKLRDESWS